MVFLFAFLSLIERRDVCSSRAPMQTTTTHGPDNRRQMEQTMTKTYENTKKKDQATDEQLEKLAGGHTLDKVLVSSVKGKTPRPLGRQWSVFRRRRRKSADGTCALRDGRVACPPPVRGVTPFWLVAPCERLTEASETLATLDPLRRPNELASREFSSCAFLSPPCGLEISR